jgi:hypothetical protein
MDPAKIQDICVGTVSYSHLQGLVVCMYNWILVSVTLHPRYIFPVQQHWQQAFRIRSPFPL